MAKQSWTHTFLMAGIMLMLIVLRFGSYLQHPERVIEPYGDGFKAYTTIAYHAMHDTSYTHYAGMHYPYGDHVIPSATQPIVSNTIRFISQNIVDISQHTIAIVNLSMLLSILLCGLFLFFIFREMEVPLWYAVIVAAGLTFLSPQIHRIQSHYGLSHPEVIPIVLYLLLKFEQSWKLKYSLWIAVVVVLYSLIHFYYFAILAFSISFYFLFKFLAKLDWRGLPRYILHYGVQMIVPLGFFVFWLFMKDHVADRTPEPWGFFQFHALWEGIVSSMDQPYFQLINEKVIKMRTMGLENRSYMGIIAFFTCFAIGINWLRRKAKGSIFEFQHRHGAFLSHAFWASLVLLVLALGVPFTLQGLEFLLDYAGPYRQFRSVGRFAWFFYYVINIIVFVWLYEKLHQHRLAYLWLSLLLGLLLSEAYHSTYGYNLDLDEVEEFKPGKSFADLEGINYEEFQALLTVPYYHIGSDQFWWEPEGYILQKSQVLSLQTGLPTTSAMLTRTSSGQTINQLQFMTEPYRRPNLLDTIQDTRPFLLMVDQREYEKEKDRYEHLLNGSVPLYSAGDRLRLYRLPLESFENRLEEKSRKLKRKIKTDTTLVWQAGFGAVDSLFNYYYDGLDDPSAEQFYFGTGGFQGVASEQNIIYVPTLPSQVAEQSYTLSLWMYIADDRRTRSSFQIDEYDVEGNHIRQHKMDCHRIIDLFDNNGWAMLEMDFKPAAADSKFQIVLTNPRLRGESIFLDELFIRPQGKDVYRKQGDIFWMNNRHYP